jgi:hypothetical protein
MAVERRLRAAVAEARGATDPAAYGAVGALVHEAREEGVRPSSAAAADRLAEAVARAVDEAAVSSDASAVERAVGMVRLVRVLGLDVDLDVAQERVHEALRDAGLDDGDRDRLAVLARLLGVAPRPLALPG